MTENLFKIATNIYAVRTPCPEAGPHRIYLPDRRLLFTIIRIVPKDLT